MNKSNVIRAGIVSVVVAFLYTIANGIIYTKTPVLGTAETLEGIEAFLYLIDEPFYLLRMLQAFLRQVWILFIAMLVLLFWLGRGQSNKTLQPDVAEPRG